MVNIVVVDDEERIRQGLAKLIAQTGEEYRVIGLFANGAELLAHWDGMEVDFVITDIKMPSMNGLELIERLRERAPNVKVAIVSGFDDFAFARQALRFGVEEYLLKPVDKGDLSQLLLKVKDRLEEERERRHAMQDEQLGLLLFNDAELLPKHLRLEAGKALERLPLFGEPYAVYVIRGERPLTEAALKAALGWLDQWKLARGEEDWVVLIGLQHGDHAERSAEIGQTLLQRLPAGFEGRIGGSDAFVGAHWLREAHRQAELALQHAWYEPGRRAFAGHSRLPRKAHAPAHLLILLDRELQETMEMSDYERAQEAIAKWFKTSIERMPPWSELREGCEAVLAYVQRYGSEKAGDAAQPELTVSCDPRHDPNVEAFERRFLGEVKERFGRLRELRQENRVVERVKAYIVQHYTEELELTRLAEEVYLTPSYLSKLFKTETGGTITDYLISVRIDRAKELLRDQRGLKTYAIGEKVGYADPAYFNKVFKKVVGCTPKEYRDRVR